MVGLEKDVEGIKTYTQDEVNDLIKKSNADLKEHVKKLNEENKNRRFSEKKLMDLIAKEFGFSERRKLNIDQIKEAFSELNTSIRDSRKELSDYKKELSDFKISIGFFFKQIIELINSRLVK